ncbi:choice-of-anchor G family protein [Kineococcus radiotolerans]|uniref:choice-of-anchor G family protein n=1 Tax=Kineococcus radiotolerans TaxID=131568 RepID=UPI000323C506|nr:choice-of-anchor G family protein [Kineococcus radiotolerans]
MSRRAVTAVVATTLAALLSVAHLGTLGDIAETTDASWVDREMVQSSLSVGGPLSCATLGRYRSASQARMTTGRLLGRDLSTVVDVAGVSVTNPGTGASAVPATTTPVGADAFRNNLTITALNTALSTDLSGVLTLPLAGTNLGAYAQYARAGSEGKAVAAAGLISDTGALALGSAATPATPASTPAGDAASIDLAKLAPATVALAGVNLGVGAVGARAALQGCQLSSNVPSAERSYGIASLNLRASVPAVKTVGTTLTTQLGAVSTTVDGLKTTLQSTLKNVVGPLLGGTAGTSTANITLDLAALNTELLTPLSDGMVTVDLRNGLVTVDVAELLSGSGGLNGQAPNTQLLLTTLNTTVPNRVTALLNTWKTQVQQRLTAVLNAAAVELRVTVAPLGLGTPKIVVINSTLGGLVQGTGTTSIDGAAPAGGLLSILTSSLLPALGAVVNTALFAAPAGAVPAVASALTPVIAAVAPALTPVMAAVTSVLTLTVNVQDSPASGVHRVSALRIGVLASTAAGSELRLATAVAGPVTSLTP